MDEYTRANITHYEKQERAIYELRWSQHFDDYSYKRIRRLLERYGDVVIRKGSIYLDLGCGYGYFVVNLLKAEEIAEHHAVDVHFNGLLSVLERARDAGRRIQSIRASIYTLSYRKESFDLITGNGVLHHLCDPKTASNVIASRLAPGGVAVFIEPTPMWEWAAERNPFFLCSWRRFVGRLIRGTEKRKDADTHAKPDTEPGGISLSQWTAAFENSGLEVNVTRFHFLCGFFRCWVVSEVTKNTKFRNAAGLLYVGVKISEYLDRYLFSRPVRGFYHVISARKS